MAGTIKINQEALNASIAELETLKGSTKLSDALQALSTAALTQSSGEAATVVKSYHGQLTQMSNTFGTLLTQTITILRNAGEYFTLTDEELADYIARKEGKGA